VSLQQLNDEIRQRIEEDTSKMEQKEKHVQFNMEAFVSKSPKVFEMNVPATKSFPTRAKPSNKVAQQQRVRQQFSMYDKGSARKQQTSKLKVKNN